MTVGLGFMILPGVSDPCASSPTISSVGTPAVSSNGNCGLFDPLDITTSVTLSGTIPTGGAIQYQYYWGTSSGGTPTGTWTNVPGWSGTTDTLVHSPDQGGFAPYTRNAGETLLGTYYYKVQFRILGTDGTTVCDGPDLSSTLTVTNVYTCAA